METKDVISLLGVVVALIGAGVALLLGWTNYLHSRRIHREGQVKDRKAEIDAALTKFYYPLLGYLNVSQALFKIFFAGKPDGFRTLTYLLDRDQHYQTATGPIRVVLTSSDDAVLKEILRLGRKIEELIVTKSGYVDDRELLFQYVPKPDITDIDPNVVRDQGLLAVAVTHLRLIRLAYRGTIQGQVDRYKAFVYPRELNGRIIEKIEALRAEREWLASLDPTKGSDWSIKYHPRHAAQQAV
jgi:hypothetical protein